MWSSSRVATLGPTCDVGIAQYSEAFHHVADDAVEGVIAITTPFELRLIGADAPDGQLDAEDLLAIVSSLKDLSTRLGRIEVDAADRGRPSREVERVSGLRIGLTPGSTRIMIERRVKPGVLDIDLADEQAVDDAFEAIITGVATNTRPTWVSDSVAESAADLTVALKKAAPEIEFTAHGQVRARFQTANTHREAWRATRTDPLSETVTVAGRLEMIDLRRHDFRVRDDVGNGYVLPKVPNENSVLHLIGSRVVVDGVGVRDGVGRLTTVREARISSEANPLGGEGIEGSVSLGAILASAPGPTLDGIPDLTDEEADAYFEAIRQ